jgi:MOSC domain-containing protein YiiM
MGENITTRGIQIRDLRIGDQLRVGGALLEITKPRGPCSALDVYGDTLKLDVYDKKVKQRDPSSPRWGISGFYANVVAPGPVRAGDAVSLISKLA